MRMKASDVASATRGQLVGPDVDVSGFSVDTRSLKSGEMFVALRGDRNGHLYIPDAMAHGAAAYLSDGATLGHKTGVTVPDTTRALADIATSVRRRFGPNMNVAAITGSTGKTSTKELLGSILRRIENVTISPASFNNEIGVPLTLLNADAESDSIVLETGARHPGDIAYLCEIAKPNVGIVTNVGLAHMGTFKTVEAITQTKGELVASLSKDGTAVLNAMDNNVMSMRARTRGRVVTYGLGIGDVQARSVEMGKDLRPTFRLHMPTGATSVFLNVRGEHQVLNALAAAAAAYSMGVPVSEITAGLEEAQSVDKRMVLHEKSNGVRIIDDVYNANPVSMRAAIDALGALQASGRSFAILGEMAELGDASPRQHEAIATHAKSLGIEIVSVDAPEYGSANYETPEEAVKALGPLRTGDAVLIKGSRVAGLERAVELIL